MNAIVGLGLRILLLGLAYAFVAWIGFQIYKDLKNTRPIRRSLEFPTLILSAQIDNKPTIREFHIPEIIIGRDPASDFPLLDDAVSLQHCKLFFKQRHWWVEDMNSTNGTYVNEDRVEAPIVLVERDEIRLGHLCIEINFQDQVRSKS